jgi:hypothetical protein
MSRGRPRHQSSRRRMYSGRQRDLRERRAHPEWNAPGGFDQESAPDADDARELEPSNSWSLQLGARASAA